MEPQKDERIWENKALREARESSHKNAVALLDIAERIGCLRNIETLEDLFTTFNGVRNKLFDQIYQDIPLHADELFNKEPKPLNKPKEAPPAPQKTPSVPPKPSEPNDATQPMKRMIWGMVYGTDGDPELEKQLKAVGLDKFTVTKKFVNYNWAHDFIEKNKTQ